MEYGLIGQTLGHSFSPFIHKGMGIEQYELCPMEPDTLGAFLCREDFKGLNVTIPYKQAVMPYCKELSPRAKSIGCVNTILKRSDGSLYGENTDYYGLLSLARQAGISFLGKRVLILGSGGTSLTARAVAEGEGASQITVVSRRGPVTYEQLGSYANTQVIINTTPVGMFPHNGVAPIELGLFPHCEGVLDVVYNPLKTELILEAESRGIPCAGGLWMLVAQAWKADELFLGHSILQEQAQKVYQELVQKQKNIVLIGMPGSGKTSVGRALAQALSRPFVDTDAQIETRAGKPIPQIFSEDGEPVFRSYESQAIAEAGAATGTVIAIGGGGAMTEQNRRSLAQNATIVLLERKQNALQLGDGRPLSTDTNAVAELWNKRMPVYRAFAHLLADNNGAMEDTVAWIKKECIK